MSRSTRRRSKASCCRINRRGRRSTRTTRGASHQTVGSPGARVVIRARGGGPPGGAIHHATRSRGGRGAPGAGHAVNADGGGSPGGVEGVGRALWLDRRACPMASLLGQKLEEQGGLVAWSQGGRHAVRCLGTPQHIGLRPGPEKYMPNWRAPLQGESWPGSSKDRPNIGLRCATTSSKLSNTRV
jgi:hypothetical protein